VHGRKRLTPTYKWRVIIPVLLVSFHGEIVAQLWVVQILRGGRKSLTPTSKLKGSQTNTRFASFFSWWKCRTAVRWTKFNLKVIRAAEHFVSTQWRWKIINLQHMAPSSSTTGCRAAILQTIHKHHICSLQSNRTEPWRRCWWHSRSCKCAWDRYVLVVITVFWTPAIVRTVAYESLWSSTLYIVKPDGSFTSAISVV